MTRRSGFRDGHVMALLAVLPAVALAPFWMQGRLLGPGDGAALHFPLRAAVWDAYRRFELPAWNSGIFFGTPLLAAYRPGAFFPLMPLLSPLHSFDAFQTLVLVSLAAAALLTFLYLRRLGAHIMGAYVAALSFSLGPYLLGHLGDTATIVAAPTLPLLLLATESHMNRASAARAAGLSAAVALVLLAGSPEAVRAGLALVVGRVLIGHVLGGRRTPSLWATGLAVAAGLALAAPQILPSAISASRSGLRTTGLANAPDAEWTGLAGLVLRYVSHSPAPALALAAVPLVFTQVAFRVLAVAIALCLALQWGRGPLSAAGALPLVFDLTLATLAGLSLSAQWRARRLSLGRRLRAHFLVAAMASAAALSIAATVGGPLPQTLAGAVGVLAVGFIAYFVLADNADPIIAGAFLIPLTASFLLQPHGRALAATAPARRDLMMGTTVRQAIDSAMAERRSEFSLSLVDRWPGESALDLGYGNYGPFTGRRSVNGYDPMVALRVREAFDGMGSGGALRTAFFRSDPARLAFLGTRWVQVPTEQLSAKTDRVDLGVLLESSPRFFPLPFAPIGSFEIVSWLSDAVDIPEGETVAWIDVSLASGRGVRVPLVAGRDTAEWAYDRADVRGRVRHRRPAVFESFEAPGFEGHRYTATIALPGRYNVVGIRLTRARRDARLTIFGITGIDDVGKKRVPVSEAAAFVSDTGRFREALATPSVWLFELPACQGPRVVERWRPLASDTAILDALRRLTLMGVDPEREALVTAKDAAALPAAGVGQASRAVVVRQAGRRLDLYARGPGLLVIPLAFEEGWRGAVDDAKAPLVRVNHVQTAVWLGPGMHRVSLRHLPRGLVLGTTLFALAAFGLLAASRRDRRAPR